MSFLEELVKRGTISESQISDIKNRARDNHDGNIDDALSEMGIPTEEILKAKGEYFNIPIQKVNAREISFNVLKYIPEDSARPL
jgi:hypothetical protein